MRGTKGIVLAVQKPSDESFSAQGTPCYCPLHVKRGNFVCQSLITSVTEMGTRLLWAIATIANRDTDRNTTAYILNWIEKLEEDNRLIVCAAVNAQRAVDLILGSMFEEEKETTENAVAMTISPASYGHAHL